MVSEGLSGAAAVSKDFVPVFHFIVENGFLGVDVEHGDIAEDADGGFAVRVGVPDEPEGMFTGGDFGAVEDEA